VTVVDVAGLPVIINVRDRLAPLLELLGWLERAGARRVILVDNASSYPPLVEYLAGTPHRVVPARRNLGQRAPWLTGVVQSVALSGPYVVSDPDVVPDPGCPADVFDRFADLLARHREVSRVGFGLRIDDLPECYRQRDRVIAWESQFWEDEVEPGVFAADVDTTFAMYRAGRGDRYAPALRTGPPYVARHLPWYEDSLDPTEEERFYRDHLDPSVNSWNQERLPAYLEDLVRRRSAGEAPGDGT